MVIFANPISNGNAVLVPWVRNELDSAGGVERGTLFAKVITPREGMGEVFWQKTDGKVVSWFLNGTDFQGALSLAQRLPEWRLVAQPDLNGDGDKDLLWQHQDGRLSIWYMNDVTFVRAASLRSTNPKWIVAGTGDFNNDNAVDIVFRNANGTSAIWFMNDTNFLSASLLADGRAVTVGWTLRAVGDMDGDPTPDLLWQHADGRIALWTMDGTALSKSTALPKTGTPWIVAGIADFNADDKSDILFQNRDGRSRVWLMDGTNVLSFVNLRNGTAMATGWRIVGPK